ncbi:MAG: dihydroxy-acid dehydratase [Rhodopseudomonas palustris]|nr:dihydroxy-acid dehydratase [Rhodopseudomonas palustris]
MPRRACSSTRAARSSSTSYDDMAARIDDPDARRSTAGLACIVLQNAGPAGRARHARVGPAADPEEAARRQGVRDMVRISDARMSGTQLRRVRAARGARSRYVGGPLALVRDGDRIDARRAGAPHPRCTWTTPSSRAGAPRGSRRRRATSAASAALYLQHVTQADEGCDFDFLETGSAQPVPEPDIY